MVLEDDGGEIDKGRCIGDEVVRVMAQRVSSIIQNRRGGSMPE